MSELTKICLMLGLVLAIVYTTLIYFSNAAGRSMSPYVTCIIINILVALWFWYIATRPSDDPQAGMGLGPIMIICGLITVALPMIATIIFFVRKIF